jgi:hypothetical protein
MLVLRNTPNAATCLLVTSGFPEPIALKHSDRDVLVFRDPELPDWVEVDDQGMRIVTNPIPFREMFWEVNGHLLPEEILTAWHAYLVDNPQLDPTYRVPRTSRPKHLSSWNKIWGHIRSFFGR